MNYVYITEELRNAFTYKESEKGYLDMISDSCQSDVTIKDGGYKLGNKYYITVNNEDNKEIELVLLKNDNSYYFYSAKVKNMVQNTAKENNQQNSVSNAEISEIENFINDLKNQAFALTNYDNPQDLLKNEQNLHNISDVLSYSIKQSGYAIPANAEQNKVIWNTTNGEALTSTMVVDIKDIVKFLKEKTNYDYSEAEVKNCFKVTPEIDKYVIQITDTIFKNYKIKNVTKNGDKYNVKLYVPDSERVGETDVDIVLTKDNGKYYFYSCNLNNFNKISQEKTAQLENFINDPGNHAFVYMNYNSSKDLVSETYDAKKAQTIIQSLIEGGYAKLITEQELKIVGSQEKPTYTISLEDLDKFLQEKTNTGFDQDALKKAFKYEYNEKLGKLVIQTAGALDKDNKIVDVYKAGNYEYWLKLSKGQEVVLFERTNGEIFFKSCTGYKNQ